MGEWRKKSKMANAPRRQKEFKIRNGNKTEGRPSVLEETVLGRRGHDGPRYLPPRQSDNNCREGKGAIDDREIPSSESETRPTTSAHYSDIFEPLV